MRCFWLWRKLIMIFCHTGEFSCRWFCFESEFQSSFVCNILQWRWCMGQTLELSVRLCAVHMRNLAVQAMVLNDGRVKRLTKRDNSSETIFCRFRIKLWQVLAGCPRFWLGFPGYAGPREKADRLCTLSINARRRNWHWFKPSGSLAVDSGTN